MQKEKKNIGLVWFRNDLRTHDNHSLKKACDNHASVLGVYCFDPRMFAETSYGFKKTERFRAKFLIETVSALKTKLLEFHIPLFVFVDLPENTIPLLLSKHQIAMVYLQKEWTEEEVQVLKNLKAASPSDTVWVETFDQFLFHPDDIPYKEFRHLPDVFTVFRKECEKNTPVQPEVTIGNFKNEQQFHNETRIPGLNDLGFIDFETDPRTAFPFLGGENSAEKRLQEYFWKTRKLAFYKKTRNGLLGTDYSSKFSPWLANGSISARTIYAQVKKFEQEVVKNEDTYWLIFELIWRDYFKYVSLKHGNSIFKSGGIFNRPYHQGIDKKLLSRWICGETEDAFINANMLEIAQTGWMSNRGRQNVASYWSMHLMQDWRIGAAYFESMLLDYDVHSNWGNWMYNSGVGNDPRNRTFNSARQAEMYDPEKKFQKKWLQQTLF